MVLFAIFAAEGLRYNELVNSFRRSDATVLKADISQLETMGDVIDSLPNTEKAFSGGIESHHGIIERREPTC